jgi:hypothetical protein
MMLQQTNLSAQGRLGHIQPLSRPAEMQLFGYSHKTAQLADLKHLFTPSINGTQTMPFLDSCRRKCKPAPSHPALHIALIVIEIIGNTIETAAPPPSFSVKKIALQFSTEV